MDDDTLLAIETLTKERDQLLSRVAELEAALDEILDQAMTNGKVKIRSILKVAKLFSPGKE